VKQVLQFNDKRDDSRADQATGEDFKGGFHAFDVTIL